MEKKRNFHGWKKLWCKWLKIMKLTFFIFLVSLLTVNATSYSQENKLNLKLTKRTLSDVFEEVERQSDYYFLFKDGELDTSRKISIDLEGADIEEVLDVVLDGTSMNYQFVDRYIVIGNPGSAMYITQQTKKLKGKVTDDSGNTMPGVTVFIKGTSNGTTTNMDGNYEINVNPGTTIVFSFVGMESQEVIYSGEDKLNIILRPDALEVEEVVVTALGIRREEKSLTYATQEVSGEELMKVKDANVMGGLQGKMSGLIITKNTSGAGGSTKVLLRGNKSIQGLSQPLYVIDGVPMLNKVEGQITGIFGGRDGGDGLSQMNPEDVESITVLKGATASALYGSQGANGVILITTKQGKAGQPKISFSSNTTMDSPLYLPEIQTEYGQTAENSVDSWGSKSSYEDQVEDFYRTGVTLINSLSMSGGNDKMQTYFSYSNTYSSGILPTNDYHKNNLSIRETADFFDGKLELDASVALTEEKTHNSPNMGFYFNPLTGLYSFPRGLNFEDYKDNFEVYNPSRNLNAQNWFVDSDFQQNPYWILNRNQNDNWVKRIFSTVKAKYNITDDLNLQVRGNYDYTNRKYEQRVHATTTSVLSHETGRYTYSNWDNTSMYADAILNYNKNINENWDLTAIIGGSYQKQIIGDGFRVDSNTDGLHVTNVFSISNVNTSSGVGISSIISSRLIKQGVFGNFQLAYKKKLYLDVTGRNDWASSLSHTDNLSYFYPSFGLTGIISEMIDLPDAITFAKLRTSYSVVGNEVPAFLTNPVTNINSKTGQEPQTTEPFTELKPEKQENFEIGLDMRFLNGRISFDATYYNINNKDQYVRLPAPASSKYQNFYVNAGHIKNSGFEATVNFVPVKKHNLTWNSTINFSSNKNEIKELHEDLPNDRIMLTEISGNAVFLEVGGSFDDLYTKGYKKDDNGNVITDDNGIPEKSDDYEKVGRVNPKFNLSWNNSLSFGKFNISMLIDGKFDYNTVSLTEQMLDFFGVSQGSADARNNGGVSIPELGTKVDAKAYYTKIGGRGGIAQPYVYDATNIRIRQLAVAYNIDTYNFKFIKGATVSLVANNLLMLYNKAPHDPDVTMSVSNSFQATEFFSLPSTRSIGLNVKLNF